MPRVEQVVGRRTATGDEAIDVLVDDVDGDGIDFGACERIASSREAFAGGGGVTVMPAQAGIQSSLC